MDAWVSVTPKYSGHFKKSVLFSCSNIESDRLMNKILLGVPGVLGVSWRITPYAYSEPLDAKEHLVCSDFAFKLKVTILFWSERNRPASPGSHTDRVLVQE